MNDKLGQEHAFSCVSIDGAISYHQDGMSKRFYAACAAVSGILSNSECEPTTPEHFKNIAEDAYKVADELLKQEYL